MTIEVESTQVAEIFEKDVNKLCEDINVVIEAHNKLVDENAELKNIIKEAREEVRIYEEQSNDGTTNELDNYVFVQRLKKVLDKDNKK